MVTIRKLFIFLISCIILPGNLAAHVDLDYPVGGENFQANETISIKWHTVINHGAANWDLYFSKDGGATWDTIATDIPQSQLDYDWTIPNIATDSAQIRVVQDNASGTDYMSTSNNFIIDVSTGTGESVNYANDFSLFPAYPNPFNPSTTIKYSLPKASFVTIKIYDVLGHEVETLVNAEKSAGNYKVKFNASKLTSGIYFYKMKAGIFLEVHKLLLLK